MQSLARISAGDDHITRHTVRYDIIIRFIKTAFDHCHLQNWQPRQSNGTIGGKNRGRLRALRGFDEWL